MAVAACNIWLCQLLSGGCGCSRLGPQWWYGSLHLQLITAALERFQQRISKYSTSCICKGCDAACSWRTCRVALRLWWWLPGIGWSIHWQECWCVLWLLACTGRIAAGPSAGGLDPEAEEKRRREEAEAARAAARAHGTPVTVEAFNAWRKKFEAEQAIAKVQLAEGSKADGAAGRLTGKQWFMQQLAAGKEVSSSEEEEEEEDADEDFEPEVRLGQDYGLAALGCSWGKGVGRQCGGTGVWCSV